MFGFKLGAVRHALTTPFPDSCSCGWIMLVGSGALRRAAAASTLPPRGKVRRGEVSKGRQLLTAAALVPGTVETLQALTEPDSRPCRPIFSTRSRKRSWS